MKLNFRKIAAIGMSAMTLGLTAGVAAAAAAPQPFVDGSTGDFAVVYGSDAPGGLDQAQATSVAEWLQGMTSGSISVEGGEAFALDKTSNHFNFNNTLNSVYGSLDDDEMAFLADGTYDDGNIDTDFEQSITLSDQLLELFADTDYNNDEPTVGFQWTNGELILSYTIDFDDAVAYTDMEDTELPLLGGTYYVLSASNTTNTIELLDTSEKHTLSIGESATIAGKNVELTFVDSDEVRFTVDGETTDLLNDNEEYELADGSYIVPTAISYQDYAGGVQSAEFSIGSGKITLESGADIEVNDEDVDEFTSTITNASTTTVDSITLTWNSDRDSFLTESNSLSMPVFGVIQLAYGGLDFPAGEDISLDNGETMTISTEGVDLPFGWYDSTTGNFAFGEEDHRLVTGETTVNYSSPSNLNLAGGLDLNEDERFIVTSIGDDLSDVETLYYEVTTIENSSGDIEVVLDDLIGTNDITFDALESDDVDTVTVTLVAVNGTTAGDAYINFSTSVSGATIYYNKVVSDKGLVIDFSTTESAYNSTGGTINFTEPDKDEDLLQGYSFTATVKNSSNDELHVSTHSLTAFDEEESDDNYVGWTPSDLATKFMYDTSADENQFSLEFYGKEVTADVQVVAGGDVTTDASLGGVLVTDSEVSSVQSRNLVVVGGSCINTVAADLVGGAYCGSDWTEQTGVGQGQFLIQSYGDAFTDGKVALLVAGYEAADTAAAASRLINQPETITTDAGTKYLGVVGSAGTSTITEVTE